MTYPSSNYDDYAGDVVIPSSVTYNGTRYGVTSIGNQAFFECINLTSVVIPNSVTTIGKEAFRSCFALTSAVISNSVTSIGEKAFIYCKSLTHIEIPNALTIIPESAFEECTGITSVVIPNSVNIIEASAFRECSSIASVEIPNSVTKIGNYAFLGCGKLASIDIPNSVTSIGYSAFHTCKSLTSIEIPNSISVIHEFAFYQCDNLTSAVIPNSVTVIEDYAFNGTNLRNLTFNAEKCELTGTRVFPTTISNLIIGDKVTQIPDNFLYNGSELEKLVIPNSVTLIGTSAFQKSKNLRSIVLGSGLTLVCMNAFADCNVMKAFWLGQNPPQSALTVKAALNYVPNTDYSFDNQLVYPELNSYFEVDGNCFVPVDLSEHTCDLVDCSYDDANNNVVVGNTVVNTGEEWNVRNINNYAFYLNSHVETISISNQGNIGKEAFFECENMTSASVKNIGSIGYRTFGHCGLQLFELGTEISMIGEMAFDSTGNITEFHSLSIVPPVCAALALLDISKSECRLYVPMESVEAYASAPQWKDFYNIIGVEPVKASEIILSETRVSLVEGASRQLTATVLPANTTDKTVTWSTSDASVATVSESGLVTAVAVGTATVTARCGEVSATCEVTVLPIVAESITLSETRVSLVEGASRQLTATVLPANTTDKTVTWSTSDANVATVSESGLVTAVSVGTATVTARCGDVSATCEVTVLPIVGESITLSETKVSIVEGTTRQLTATVLPTNTTDKTVTWSTSDASVATVSESGLVTAVAVGTAIITARCGEISATCEVEVLELVGIEELTNEDGTKYDVYTLGGVKVLSGVTRECVKRLSRGIYIVNGKKTLLGL